MDKETQEKLVQLQLIHQQLRHFQQQLGMLEQQTMELQQTKMSIAELAGVEKNKPIFVPIASGIFAKARWDGEGTFLVNVGAGSTVEKGKDDVDRLVEEQLVEAEKIKNELMEQVKKLVEHAGKLEEQIKP